MKPLAPLLSCLLAAPIVLWATAAVAESAVVLPASGDTDLAREREQAADSLKRALSSQGVDAAMRLDAIADVDDAEARECLNVDCAPRLIQVTKRDFAVAAAVWKGGESGQQPVVFVTIVARDGARFPGSAVVEAGDVDRATQRALVDARGLQLLGPGPWLRLRGRPEGAQIELDGKLVGSLPYRGTVSSGRHQLEVRAEGYGTHAQSVDVPPNAARQVDVDIVLERRAATAAGDPGLSEPAGGPEGSPRHVLGPILLGTAGAAVLAVDIASVASASCELEDPSGRCLSGSQTNTGAAVGWGVLGGSAVVGALLWFLLTGDDAEQGDQVRVGPASLSLRGHY